VPTESGNVCFGLGFEARTCTGDSVGEYGWAGNAGTLFWVDPREQLIAMDLRAELMVVSVPTVDPKRYYLAARTQ
jgi:CubicO group peptidase (beta-lactamase class C family)